jgi:cyclic pyranopterin phosphate synthase
VWKNINLLIEQQYSVKLNVVIMKGINDDEVVDFVRLSEKLPVHIRFIEFMPFDKNAWHKESVIRSNDLIEQLEQYFSFIKLIDEKHATAKKYKLLQGTGSFAFITTMSQIFCNDCNRMRLTADGKMKNCLFGKDELDLLQAYRKGEDIIAIIRQSVLTKHEKMGGQFKEISTETDANTIINRSMIKIGG